MTRPHTYVPSPRRIAGCPAPEASNRRTARTAGKLGRVSGQPPAPRRGTARQCGVTRKDGRAAAGAGLQCVECPAQAGQLAFQMGGGGHGRGIRRLVVELLGERFGLFLDGSEPCRELGQQSCGLPLVARAAVGIAFQLEPQERRLLAQLAVLHVELDEDRDLGPQHPRVERLRDVVHRARRITPEGVMRTVIDRGEEDDRDVPGPFPPLDVRGGFETVHARHLDVQQNDRKVIREQRFERFLPDDARTSV